MSDDLALERLRKQTDNTKLTPRELLVLALADLDAGVWKADKAVLVFVDTTSEGTQDEMHSYRCGMRPIEEIGILHMRAHCVADK